MKVLRLSQIIAVAALAACSGGGASTGPGGSTGNTGGTGGTGGTDCPTGAVCMLSSTFTPTSLTVSKGGTVSFVNNSGISHTVDFDGTRPPGVEDVPLNNSGTFDRVFNDTGTFKFHCTQHAGMTGQIVVQ